MCYCCRKLEIWRFSRSASNVQLSDWLILYIWGRFSIHLRLILYIWGQFSIYLRPILYIWGRVNLFCHVMPLSHNETAVHLRQNLSGQSDSCTFEADSASNVQNRPQMYSTESASNVQRISLKCTYIRGWSDSTRQGRPILGPVSLISQPIVLQWPKDRMPSPSRVQSASNVWKLASNVQHRIGLKCTDRPQMYRDRF